MQYKDVITIQVCGVNQYSEPVIESQVDIKCKILEYNKVSKMYRNLASDVSDLLFIVQAKSKAPYNQLMTKDTIRYLYNGVSYAAVYVSAIKNFSGKIQHYEIRAIEATT